MTTSKFCHLFLPTVFLSGAVAAFVLMGLAIGKNLDRTFRQLVFLPTGPSHSTEVVMWFWVAVACFVFGVVCAWQSFRYFRSLRRA